MAYSPDGKTVITGSRNDLSARLWDAATGKPIGRPLTHQSGVLSVSFSPDGKTVLTTSAGPDGAAVGRRHRQPDWRGIRT